jgi:hypothetical protein
LSQVWLSSKNLLSGVTQKHRRSKGYCYRPLPERKRFCQWTNFSSGWASERRRKALEQNSQAYSASGCWPPPDADRPTKAGPGATPRRKPPKPPPRATPTMHSDRNRVAYCRPLGDSRPPGEAPPGAPPLWPARPRFAFLRLTMTDSSLAADRTPTVVRLAPLSRWPELPCSRAPVPEPDCACARR